MPRVTFGTLVKLVVWSLVVGAVLAFVDVTPLGVLQWATHSIRAAFGDFRESLSRLGSYLLLGAGIVVPIWCVHYLWRATRR